MTLPLTRGPRIVIPAKTSPKGEVSRNGQAGIQCLSWTSLGARFREDDAKFRKSSSISEFPLVRFYP